MYILIIKEKNNSKIDVSNTILKDYNINMNFEISTKIMIEKNINNINVFSIAIKKRIKISLIYPL